MYECTDCGEVFEEPTRYVETHGFTDGRYERWLGCPYCGGNFKEREEVDDDVLD